jgi:carboxyl-terminal processing protease
MKLPHALPSVFRRPGQLARLTAVLLLSACGGGGGNLSNISPLPPPLPSGGGGGGAASSQYAQQCSASNPYRGDASTTTRTGSLSIEKQWLRAYVDEAYLWYDKVPSVNAALPAYSSDTAAGYYGSIDGYFSALTVDGVTEDRFSFSYPTKQWNDLSQGGVSLGYGIEFSIASATPPRGVRVAYVEPNTPAATAGVLRGDTLVTVDGVSIDDASTAGVATINAALFPSAAGSHTFVFSRLSITRAPVVLTAGNITSTPVPQTKVFTVGGAKIGYIVFNEHVLTAEAQLSDAVTSLSTQGVNDLVLDLRYNRGGYLFIASQLAYMVAGQTRTANKTFEQLQYNDKRTSDTNDSATPFFNCVFGTGNTCGASLPSLNLGRVYVLSGPDTCSASEAVINGLRGIDVEVVVVGGTTCGKPYGFTAKDNCGVSYFPIEFKGVNAKGFGDYADGFTATCPASDDFDHALGDTSERLLSIALNHRTTSSCGTAGINKADAPPARLLHHPERGGRIVVPGLR